MILDGPSSGFPSIFRMSSLESSLTHSRLFPFASSVSSEADAKLIAHPLPVNLMSWMTFPSPTLICMSTSSPQSGLVSWEEMSDRSRVPKLRGCL